MWVGLDIGSSTAKLAGLISADESNHLAEHLARSTAFHLAPIAPDGQSDKAIVISSYRRAAGSPLLAAFDLLEQFRDTFCEFTIAGFRVTGAGGRRAAETLGALYENEFKAIARGISSMYPHFRTIFEMGGESSKYLLLDTPSVVGPGTADLKQWSSAGILDYSASGECAAGTGSFLDQQASRLQYRVEDIGAIVEKAKSAARIAGRCSVFAKSDMIHAQQKGYATEEVLKGLCEAVARNFKSNIVRGKKVVPPVAFIGGVSQNSGVVHAIADAFKLSLSDLIVPEVYAWLGAIGAALLESEAQERLARQPANSYLIGDHATASMTSDSSEPLSLSNVLLLRDHPLASRTEPSPELGGEKLPVYLGIDIGSVSTNLALLDDGGRLLHGIYLRTIGRPIEIVDQGLQEIDLLFGSRIEVRGVGTTGSGRELIGELVGADTINDEITAHKTGAMYVHEKLVRRCRVPATDGGSVVPPIGDVDTNDCSLPHAGHTSSTIILDDVIPASRNA